MNGKQYHKMPVSSWMIPGGNREQKKMLIQEKKYPMKSAIQKNLGGPLSEVFFSNLAPVQSEHVGHMPKLLGPGSDVWVSPSDTLCGQVILRPPFTTRIKQALTHQGILELGDDIEKKINRAHEIQMEAALKKKEQEMKKHSEQLIKQAVLADRHAQSVVMERLMQTAQQNLARSYQDILTSTIDEIIADAVRRMEEAVNHTRRQLEEERSNAVESHRQYLGNQYELQMSWLHSLLSEKYENKLKKQGQKNTMEMENLRRECEFSEMRDVAHVQAEHITDLVVQACEKSKIHHIERAFLEFSFGDWFKDNFEKEIVKKDFTIVELEDVIRKLEDQSKRREQQMKELFKHFQKFINFALHEKPGQAEFLLSLETELKMLRSEVETEGEVEFIARTILDYILRCITESISPNIVKEDVKIFSKENYKEKISEERSKNRILTLVGEKDSNPHSRVATTTTNLEAFKNNQVKSLVNLFKHNPSVLKIVHSIQDQKQVIHKAGSGFLENKKNTETSSGSLENKKNTKPSSGSLKKGKNTTDNIRLNI